MESSIVWETVGDNLWVAIGPNHRFGTDAFLLADFAHPRRWDRICDLGTGCGILPFLFKRDGHQGQIYGVDIQEEAYTQFCLSCQKSRFAGEMFPILSDWRMLRDKLPQGDFSLVTVNPPYKAAGRGILSESPSDQAARHETYGTFRDICEAARGLLRFGGRFCLCHRPERLCDLFFELRSHDLEPKRLRMVQKRPETAPWLCLIEASRGGKPFLTVEPPLIVQEENGRFSPEMLRIYRKDHAL